VGGQILNYAHMDKDIYNSHGYPNGYLSKARVFFVSSTLFIPTHFFRDKKGEVSFSCEHSPEVSKFCIIHTHGRNNLPAGKSVYEFQSIFISLLTCTEGKDAKAKSTYEFLQQVFPIKNSPCL